MRMLHLSDEQHCTALAAAIKSVGVVVLLGQRPLSDLCKLHSDHHARFIERGAVSGCCVATSLVACLAL